MPGIRTRKVRLSVAVSLDGFIAGPNGEFDWIPVDPEIDFKAMMSGFDTLVMGRKSYEAMLRQGEAGMWGMKSYVISRTLRQEDHKGVIVSDDPKTTVEALKREKGKDIWLFGGGELFRSLLEMNLVDAVEVGVVPVLLGKGLPLFPDPARPAKLKLIKHRIYRKTGTVLLEYVPARPAE